MDVSIDYKASVTAWLARIAADRASDKDIFKLLSFLELTTQELPRETWKRLYSILISYE